MPHTVEVTIFFRHPLPMTITHGSANAWLLHRLTGALARSNWASVYRVAMVLPGHEPGATSGSRVVFGVVNEQKHIPEVPGRLVASFLGELSRSREKLDAIGRYVRDHMKVKALAPAEEDDPRGPVHISVPFDFIDPVPDDLLRTHPAQWLEDALVAHLHRLGLSADLAVDVDSPKVYDGVLVGENRIIFEILGFWSSDKIDHVLDSFMERLRTTDEDLGAAGRYVRKSLQIKGKGDGSPAPVPKAAPPVAVYYPLTLDKPLPPDLTDTQIADGLIRHFQHVLKTAKLAEVYRTNVALGDEVEAPFVCFEVLQPSNYDESGLSLVMHEFTNRVARLGRFPQCRVAQYLAEALRWGEARLTPPTGVDAQPAAPVPKAPARSVVRVPFAFNAPPLEGVMRDHALSWLENAVVAQLRRAGMAEHFAVSVCIPYNPPNAWVGKYAIDFELLSPKKYGKETVDFEMGRFMRRLKTTDEDLGDVGLLVRSALQLKRKGSHEIPLPTPPAEKTLARGDAVCLKAFPDIKLMVSDVFVTPGSPGVPGITVTWFDVDHKMHQANVSPDLLARF